MNMERIKIICIFILFLGAQEGFIRRSEARHNHHHHGHHPRDDGEKTQFVQRKGTHFVLNGRAMYLNGFNAYWMMYMGSDPATRVKVSNTLEQANSKYGMNVARIWAFSDGGSRPLQASPGVYHEDMFQGLDFVIAEAKKNGVYLILSLVNNWGDFGGRRQYVQWGKDSGHSLSGDDDFYTDSVVKGYFKDHIKAILTRKNSITGVVYKDDPTIFAWELMNEPRSYDWYGKVIQSWVEEMATYVKSIDPKHLLEIGMEGFYGESERTITGNEGVGTSFIANNLIPEIDFATIHLYPDQWVGGLNETGQAAFVDEWITAHLNDSATLLGKPLVLSEFGKSSRSQNYQVSARDAYLSKIYDTIYSSAKTPGSASAGTIFWQVMAPGMDSWFDGYEVVLEESPTTTAVISRQSSRLSALTKTIS